MNANKFLATALVGTMILTGCGNKVEETPKTETPTVEVTPEVETEKGFTGVAVSETLYDATSDKKDMIITEITFENGQPTDLKMDVRLEDGTMKSELSASGEYVMNADAEYVWHEQLELVANFLKENNFDISAINLTDEAGHTDTISGVSIKIPTYLTAVQDLLTAVETGTYVPVAQTEETAAFTGVATSETLYDAASDKKDMIITEITFENGQPTDLKMDVRLEDGTMKSELSASGEYVMNADAEYVWHEQLELVANFLKENNFDITAINLTDEAGHTDTISGVSMKIPTYLTAVQDLLTAVETGTYSAE